MEIAVSCLDEGLAAPRRKPGRAGRPPPDDGARVVRRPHRPRPVRSRRDCPRGGGPALWAGRARQETRGGGARRPARPRLGRGAPGRRFHARQCGSLDRWRRARGPALGAPGNRRLPAPERRRRPRGSGARDGVRPLCRPPRVGRESSRGHGRPSRRGVRHGRRSGLQLPSFPESGRRPPAPLRLGALRARCPHRRGPGRASASGSSAGRAGSPSRATTCTWAKAPAAGKRAPRPWPCFAGGLVLLDRVELPVREVYDLVALPRGATRTLATSFLPHLACPRSHRATSMPRSSRANCAGFGGASSRTSIAW